MTPGYRVSTLIRVTAQGQPPDGPMESCWDPPRARLAGAGAAGRALAVPFEERGGVADDLG